MAGAGRALIAARNGVLRTPRALQASVPPRLCAHDSTPMSLSARYLTSTSQKQSDSGDLPGSELLRIHYTHVGKREPSKEDARNSTRKGEQLGRDDFKKETQLDSAVEKNSRRSDKGGSELRKSRKRTSSGGIVIHYRMSGSPNDPSGEQEPHSRSSKAPATKVKTKNVADGKSSVVKGPSPKHPVLKTIVVTDPETMDFETLLPRIPQVPEPLNEPYVAVLLATPLVAQMLELESDESKLAEIMQRMFGNATQLPERIISVIAVVDRMPLFWRVNTQADGISFCITPLSSLTEAQRNSLETPRESTHIDASGAVSFGFRWPKLDPETGRNVPTESRIQVPLANTVFHTGRRSTMYLAHWTTNGMEKLGLSHWSNPSHLSFSMAMSVPVERRLQAPVRWLTPSRRIESAAGNIVRKIEGENQDVVTASAELEKVVPAYLKENRSEDGRLDIWASVKPNAGVFTPHAREQLQLRDHVHKVLSGGGGWGIKAGLLSLDPETTFMEEESQDNAIINDVPFREFFATGDAVRFFTDDRKPAEATAEQDKRRFKDGLLPNTKAVLFGTSSRLPLLSDSHLALELSRTDQDTGSDKPELATNNGWAEMNNMFGAVSDAGVVLERYVLTDDNGKQILTSDQWKTDCSKFDIPGFQIGMAF